MARLDPFIELMFKETAEVLLRETGASAALVQGDNIRTAMQRTLTTAQIAGACAELVPAYQRDTFNALESEDFEYKSPAGTVRVRIEPAGEGIRATFEPVAAPATKVVSMVHEGFHAVAVPKAAPPPAPEPEPERQGLPAEPPPADTAAAMRQLLDLTVEHKASDLHLTSGFPPYLRIDG